MIIDTIAICLSAVTGAICAAHILTSKSPVWVKVAALLFFAGWLVEAIIYLASP